MKSANAFLFFQFKSLRLVGLATWLASGLAARAVDYEVYPGSAFYLTQMVDSVSYPYVAQSANGFYFHPTGFKPSLGVELTPAEKRAICNNFRNRFAMVEGDMGNVNTDADLKDIHKIISLGLTPVAAFVNRPADADIWPKLIAKNAAFKTPSYEMIAPHLVCKFTDGFYNTNFDDVRANMLVPGCLGSGVDAPIFLYHHFTIKKTAAAAAALPAEQKPRNGTLYQQAIWDQRDWTVAHGKKFNYLISPNNSTGRKLIFDTEYLIRSLEDNGHEADVYGVVLYGRRPVDLTPETTNYNGIVQANWTITGQAYYLLKHRDGEPGSLDLYATGNSASYAKDVTSPVLANPAQIIPFDPVATNQFTLTLTNRSEWLDYAAVLRARTQQSANWNIQFQIGTRNITRAVLSETGFVFLVNRRLLPQTEQQVTLTLSPKGAPKPLDLVIEALPHAGVDQALDVIAFQYQTNQSPPTLNFPTVARFTRPGLATTPIWFTVGDAETLSSRLTVTGTSANQALVPNANIVFGQSGLQRWVNLTPVANQSGIAPITLTVSDGQFRVSKAFNLTVGR
jgi:hypothetical protein